MSELSRETAVSAEPTEGERWLSAAATGGLPEPSSARWKPLRIGIVNLWEYDEEEFWFADGRLVLRGGNGAGKTKVLELTTLLLLRGEVSPSVLDPFGSQHRSMRFNLLPTGEGDDPREPSDAGLGYAWAEFGRRDEDGQAQYYMCGLGASARRATGTTGVKRWQLISRLRPGQDFRFSVGGRPLDKTELAKVAGVDVTENATQYRSRLADELFGMDSEAYDNLTELLKQLRKPKLGERLNPGSLSETLRDALPPLANREIAQLAEGWDRLEQLRKAVEDTKDAAKAVAGFARQSWRPWASIVVRGRADALTRTTSRLQRTTEDRQNAEAALTEQAVKVTVVDTELRQVIGLKADGETERRELLESSAYQDAVAAAGRVESLREQLASLRVQLTAAEGRKATAQRRVDSARTAVEQERGKATAGEERFNGAAAELRTAALPIGLSDQTTRHLETVELEALHVETERRKERFERHRELRGVLAEAETESERSAAKLGDLQTQLSEAGGAEQAARAEVENAVENLRALVREWAAGLTVAVGTETQVEDWCELVADLAGSGDAESPVAAIREHLDKQRETLTTQAEELRAELRPLVAESKETEAELRRIGAAEDEAPPAPTLWQRRDRPESGGSPFWRCVRPRSSLAPGQLDVLEAALSAAGLLDAWVTPDGALLDADGNESFDVQVAASAQLEGGLGEMLSAEEVDDVPVETIAGVLATVGWYDSRDDAGDTISWIAADGAWRLGALTGRAAPSRPASYLGATARQAARERRIAELEEQLETLRGLINVLESELTDLAGRQKTLTAESGRVPRERPVTDAMATLLALQERSTAVRDKLSRAETEHREQLSDRDVKRAAFMDHAGQFGFPTEDLTAFGAALADYRDRLGRVVLATELLQVHRVAVVKAEDALSEHTADLELAADELESGIDGEREARIRLETAEKSVATDHRDLLRRRAELDRLLAGLTADERKLIDEQTDARVAVAKAEAVLLGHETQRGLAEEARDVASREWWDSADAGLWGPLDLTVPDRRVVETARDTAREARRQLRTVGDGTPAAAAAAADRAWRKCVGDLQQLRQELLPNRDIRVPEDVEDESIPRVQVMADSGAGWQAPQEAADGLAERVREQESKYDNEQQSVLATLLGSTFIEHLKDRLDYTEHTFTDINRQLADHPTRHGHVVRLDWSSDPADPEAGAVVQALSQGYQQLGTERQDQVRAFLARKIELARAEAAADGSSDWKEELGTALDYRRWLRITLEFRPGATTKWVTFDAARHGTKSGGEKVVLLSQPLFAAAVVAYNAAGPYSPRCVWLDEAMTGVDVAIKESFMGLTVSFDLDVMLTAHDEWCTYRTVPAVAIYDLARHPHLPGVDVDTYLWSGGERTAVERLAVSPPADEPEEDTLFGAGTGE